MSWDVGSGSVKEAATRGFATPGCGKLGSDSRQAYRIDMPHGACHSPRGTRPDVYGRSIPKPTLRSYFARIDNMVFCTMTDSSFDREDGMVLLAEIALSLEFA